MTSVTSFGESTNALERPLWRHPAFGGTLMVSALVVLAAPYWQPLIESMLLDLESVLAAQFESRSIVRVQFISIPLAGFAFGLLASVSPCVLPLIPLNLAYIGASEASGRRAASLSTRFVLGSALALSAIGLLGDLAGYILIDHRGALLLGAGLALIYFGLAVLVWVQMPTRHPFAATRRLGPVGAGAAFALLTTPCSSPLLAAALSAAAAQAVAGLTLATMLAFSLGSTLLVLLGGIFGNRVLGRISGLDFAAPRAVAVALLMASGSVYALAGTRWF